jgi:hypothetical protein
MEDAVPVIYYHVTQPLLAAGSIIENGNFGRILDKYAPGFGDVVTLYREEVLEAIRKEQFPDKPSRFHSIFLLDTLENAVCYRDHNAQHQNIYTVEIVDTDKAIHKGFWCPPFPIGNYRHYCFEYAKRYWNGEIERISIRKNNGKCTSVMPVELIIESPVKVLERILT